MEKRIVIVALLSTLVLGGVIGFSINNKSASADVARPSNPVSAETQKVIDATLPKITTDYALDIVKAHFGLAPDIAGFINTSLSARTTTTPVGADGPKVVRALKFSCQDIPATVAVKNAITTLATTLPNTCYSMSAIGGRVGLVSYSNATSGSAEPSSIKFSTGKDQKTANVSWTSEVPTTAEVIYGTTKTDDGVTVKEPFQTLYNGIATKEHTVILKDLIPNTTYFFRIFNYSATQGVANGISTLQQGTVASTTSGIPATLDWTGCVDGVSSITGDGSGVTVQNEKFTGIGQHADCRGKNTEKLGTFSYKGDWGQCKNSVMLTTLVARGKVEVTKKTVPFTIRFDDPQGGASLYTIKLECVASTSTDEIVKSEADFYKITFIDSLKFDGMVLNVSNSTFRKNWCSAALSYTGNVSPLTIIYNKELGIVDENVVSGKRVLSDSVTRIQYDSAISTCPCNKEYVASQLLPFLVTSDALKLIELNADGAISVLKFIQPLALLGIRL